MGDEGEVSMLKVADIGGRGRALVAGEPLRAGQVVLRDSPILLYSAFPLQSSTSYCDHCFRMLQSQPLRCSRCFHSSFCSSTCLQVANSSSHTLWVCESLRRLRDCSSAVFADQSPERQVQARFLVTAYNLAAVSPSNFRILMSLHGEHSLSTSEAAVARSLHSLLTSVCPPLALELESSVTPSPDLSAALLTKDKFNAFGLMEPFSISQEKRSVRAYAIYPRASFFNHDCLPNACQFDYVDSSVDRNTDIIVRIIHDVPQGREICLSYFPVNLKYSSRQSRLLEDYGFICDCDRCKVEANWSDDEEEDGKEQMEEDADAQEEQMVASDADNEPSGADTEFPHAYFFLRYMCDKENCSGTLAPLPPSDSNPSRVLECNVCGRLKEDELVDVNQ